MAFQGTYSLDLVEQKNLSVSTAAKVDTHKLLGSGSLGSGPSEAATYAARSVCNPGRPAESNVGLSVDVWRP